MARFKKNQKGGETEEKVLEVDASMQGSLVFKDAVNLRINGKFEGTLNTKGQLYVGERAEVKADIKGEDVTIAGRVSGDITAQKRLKVVSPGQVTGNINTKALIVEEGARIDGYCNMSSSSSSDFRSDRAITVDELAKYLEVDTSMIFDWAKNGRIPATKRGEEWIFDRIKIDEWLLKEKAK